MSKYNKLAKNTGVFFIANFGSKALSFFLVRFYTELLSAEEYGIIDLLNTTASLALPIMTLCITEAVLRFSIDDNENRGKILTSGLLVATIGNLVFIFSAPIFSTIDVFSENIVWLYLLTFTNSIYLIVAHFSRGIGKSKLFAASGLTHTALQISLNILLLLGFSLGIKGYLIASVLANILTAVIVFILGNLYNYIVKNIEKDYIKKMLIYSIPLIPNSVFWWIMQSSDRYVITWMLSPAENGLYAVANKIPTLITTISSIFFQAWQISSVEESMSKQKNQFYSNVFSGLAALLILASSFIMVVLNPLYTVLTEETYHDGVTAVPFLLCAMVYSCFSSFLGTNYVAMKKTKGVFLTTVIGAVVNLILNIALTPIVGIEGTALATLISFIITWICRIYGTRKFVQIQYPLVSFWMPSLLLLVQSIIFTLGFQNMIIHSIIFAAIIILSAKFIIGFLKIIIQFITRIISRKNR